MVLYGREFPTAPLQLNGPLGTVFSTHLFLFLVFAVYDNNIIGDINNNYLRQLFILTNNNQILNSLFIIYINYRLFRHNI